MSQSEIRLLIDKISNLEVALDRLVRIMWDTPNYQEHCVELESIRELIGS